MAALICKTQLPAVDGLEDNQVTVGRHQILTCDGDWSKPFDFSKATFKVSDAQKNIVRVMKAEARTLTSFDVDFVLYGAGSHEFTDFILTDGTTEIQLGQQTFQVASVIQPPPDGQPPKPYGPILPLTLHWPALYFVIFITVVATALFYLVYKVRRHARYKKLIEGLRQYDSSLEPDLQFYKTMRSLEKNDYPVSDVERAFRLYALRLYQLPLFDLNNRQSLHFMKKRRPQFKKQRTQLQKFLEEFEELSKKESELSSLEKAQLAKKLYKFVDMQTGARS